MSQKSRRHMGLLIALLLGGAIVPVTNFAFAETPTSESESSPALRNAGPLRFSLQPETQTLAHLQPKSVADFDYLPYRLADKRKAPGFNAVGDINLRLRTGNGKWQDFGTNRRIAPARTLRAHGDVLASADVSKSMGVGIPLQVVRSWVKDKNGLVLRFTLKNTVGENVEIGALGFPMVFDNVLTGRDLDAAHSQASFVDPYIGLDAGYLQVTRLNGEGPVLLVLPESGTPLESYTPLMHPAEAPHASVFTDPGERAQPSEGFYEWSVATRARAEVEWKEAKEQWNPPTSFVLAPGQSRTFGLRMVLAESTRKIQDALLANERPVALGVPGYVVPQDMDAQLYLKHTSKVDGIDVYPAGALDVRQAKSNGKWQHYTLNGKQWGRSRLTVNYADGTRQVVSYFVTKPVEEARRDLGRFSTTRQWFVDPSDPFGRSPSVMTYDRSTDSIVDQEERVWVSGLSDEAGSGAWLAAVSAQLDNPSAQEVERLEEMIDKVIVGGLQIADGEHAGAVKKSMFYYDPVAFPDYPYSPKSKWTGWNAWDKEHAGDLGRAFNYPHVAIAHWVMYRAARNTTGIVKRHDWQWYLDHAYNTIVAMMRDAPYYTQFGLMEGNVFISILDDLRREGWNDKADEIEQLMKKRAEHWASLKYPFGSEMSWDSTGQPEVYAWLDHFGYDQQAAQTRDVILAYDPFIPHWGYNGNARRYWDFWYAGKYPRIERQIHHYGSTNSAIALLEAFRKDPTDMTLLRVGYGGLLGGITNIDQEGFGSAAFHSYPDRMDWDPYTGDYGPGFFAHTFAASSYLVKDPELGWQAYGGNLQVAEDRITIWPKDGARTRLFIAPAGVWIQLDSGKIAGAVYRPSDGSITLTLDPATKHVSRGMLRIETTAGTTSYKVVGGTTERDAQAFMLGSEPTVVKIVAR